MLAPPPKGFRLEPLANQDRAEFSCGAPSLDDYIRRQAGQDSRRQVATVFLLIDDSTGLLAGYYTLSSTSIVATALPESMRKRLPRHDAFPATLLGRLAVDQRQKERGLGKWLLVDACIRSLLQSTAIASLAVVVDALDDSAERFYATFGFQRLGTPGRRLFLPMASIAALAE